MSNLTSLCVVHISVPFSPSSFFVLLCFFENQKVSTNNTKGKIDAEIRCKNFNQLRPPMHLFYFFRRKFFFLFCFVVNAEVNFGSLA